MAKYSEIPIALENSLSTLFESSIILIVDDMPNNLEVLSDTLADAGFEVAVATDGEGALQQLEHTPVSLILLDVMMPDIDGFETCRRIKKNPATQNIPVIFITALSDVINKVQGFDLGAVDYITKPFQQGEVLARVRTHLKISHLSQTLEVKNIELQQSTEKLEQRVTERTQELFAQKQTLEKALLELQQAQIRLIQGEKMSALGNLVAGVAHEINNPIGFLSGNIKPALDYVQDLFGLLDLYQQKYPAPDTEIQSEIEAIDLDYIRADLPKLVGSMQEGVKRIRAISTSLRTFSRADSDRPVACNIHDGIDSTLLILKHRLKANEFRPEIQVVTDYGDLPLVECFAGQLNQVFMNLLANAIDALEDANQGRNSVEIQTNPNQILIKTALSADRQQAIIWIRDNGIGMTEQVLQKIFEHLFTTKGVGQGTGLGLAIAHQIVVEKHGGKIIATSTPGQGTEFIITLPMQDMHQE